MVLEKTLESPLQILEAQAKLVGLTSFPASEEKFSQKLKDGVPEPGGKKGL